MFPPARRNLFRFMVTLVTLLTCTTLALADGAYQPVRNPVLNISRMSGEIVIDGDLTDSGWRTAGRADTFAEHQPGDQTRPPVNTEAMITYDDKNVYIAMICYDDPTTIRASLCERDRVFSDDNVCLLIDTYGDAAWAYEFNVNPYGIQGDLLWSQDNGEDSRFDIIWDSAGKITDEGYQIEVAIPFASLRFPDKAEQVWKVDFWRNHPRDIRRQYSWAAYDRDESCWPCQWGTVTGINNVESGKGIEILPAIVTTQGGALAGDGVDDPFDFQTEDTEFEASLNAKYSISSNTTAEITVNPDFSQIEGDPGQIDVNTNFALFKSERRPFFQEGSDLFNTRLNVVYTRTINDPLVAAKFTRRSGRLSIAYLTAYDEHSPLILPFEESSGYLLNGESVSNLLRVRRTFAEDSQLGFLGTDRRLIDGGSGTLLGLDGNLRISQSFRFKGQIIATHTEEPDDASMTEGFNGSTFDDGQYTTDFDGEQFWGHGISTYLGRSTRNSDVSLEYDQLSPTFRADNGYQPRNNQRLLSGFGSYTYRMDSGLFQWLRPEVQMGREWNFDGERKDEYIRLNLAGQFRFAQGYFHGQYLASNERLGGIDFDGIFNYHMCANLTPNRLIAFGGHIEYGDQIARQELVMGRETTLGLWFDIRPLNRLLIENWYDFSSSYESETDEELFKGYIARTRVSLQVLKELSVRMVVQYNDFRDSWDLDPLLTYRINPFSVLHMGSTFDYKQYEGLGPDGNETDTRLNRRQYFLKLQYLFQV
ncbi:MAG: carbohydrate binding family 9 domain-containing protein [bacterium]|nr:carbohydrate binding family 9 domain-containing protein [bacterium]